MTAIDVQDLAPAGVQGIRRSGPRTGAGGPDSAAARVRIDVAG